MAERGRPQGPGRRQPLGRHPPAPLPAPGTLGHRPVPEGRVDPPDRQPQAPPRPLPVPLRPVQRLDPAGPPGDRGVQRLDGRLRGVLRQAGRRALHRRHAPHDEYREDPPDRVPRRTVPLRGRLPADVRGIRPPRGGDRRPLHGPVHLRRTCHRLARQQQHRRVDLPPAASGAVPRALLDRRHGRHRRHLGDPRPLRPLHAVRHPGLRRRPGQLLLLRGLDHRRPRRGLRPRLPHRGHRPAPDGTELRARRDRPHDESAGRGERRGRALPGACHRPQGGRLHGHRPVERAEDRRRDGGRGGAGQCRDAAVRPGDRYLDKYYSDAWLVEQGLDIEPYTAAIESLLRTGSLLG